MKIKSSMNAENFYIGKREKIESKGPSKNFNSPFTRSRLSKIGTLKSIDSK